MNDRMNKMLHYIDHSINIETIINNIDKNFCAAYIFDITDKNYNYRGFKIGSTSILRLPSRHRELETQINSFISYSEPRYYLKALFICEDRDTAYAIESFIRRFYHQNCKYKSMGQDHFIGVYNKLSQLLNDKRFNQELVLNNVQKIIAW